jgi:hypothetical protein
MSKTYRAPTERRHHGGKTIGPLSTNKECCKKIRILPGITNTLRDNIYAKNKQVLFCHTLRIFLLIKITISPQK